MLKFARGNSHDIYPSAPKSRKIGTSQTGHQIQEPGPPKNISLESLRNLAAENEPEPPKSISLESLIAYSREQSSIRSVALESLNETRAEKASSSRLPHPRSKIPNKSSQLDGTMVVAVAVASIATAATAVPRASSTDEECPEFSVSANQVRNKRRSEMRAIGIRKTVSAPALPIIQNRRRYQKPAASLPPAEESTTEPSSQNGFSVPTPESKPSTKAEKREKTTTILQKKHEILLEKLKELSVEENLEAWLKSVNMPKEINIPELRAKITEFIKNKSWETGNSRWLLDGSLTKRLWQDFKELSTAKQVVIIIALSILIALVGFLTLQLLSLLWPGLLGLATSGESILVEIGVEAFKQRQEPAFHLLMDHAEQAKPLTTAWANQYILWKYMRRP